MVATAEEFKATLAVALVAAQAEMPAVDKTGRGNFGTYATLDHLIALTRPVLNKHGLSIMQLPVVSELGQPMLRTIIRHESGESVVADAPLFLPKQDMQALGSAITYARRYGWASACGVASEHDDDGDSASSREGAAGAAHSPAAPAPTLTDEEFRWTTGKNTGKTLAETPDDYLDWYVANGPKQDVRAAIELHREFVAVGAGVGGGDDDIPFAPTLSPEGI